MAKSRRKRVSAKRYLDEHKTGFESTAINVGEDIAFQLTKSGVRRIDVIPYVVSNDDNPYADKDEWHYERTYYQHVNVGPDSKKYICLQKMQDKPCPICEHAAELASDPDHDKDELKALRVKERQLFNVIDLDDRDAGIQVFDISHHLFGSGLKEMLQNADPDEPYEFFADPEDGMSLKLGVKKESFQGHPYFEVASIAFKERRKQYTEDIVKEAHILDELVLIPEYEEVKKLFLMGSPKNDDKDDSDDDDEPNKDEGETAESLGIEEGSKVMYDDEECEVTRISRDGSRLMLEGSDGEVIKAIRVTKVELVEDSEPEKEPEPEPEPEKKAPPKKKRGRPPKAKKELESKPERQQDDDKGDDGDDWENEDWPDDD